MRKLSMVFGLLLGSTSIFAQSEKQVLFTNKNQNEVFCYRIPSIVKTSKNHLIAVADERNGNCWDLKDNTNINIAQRISKDGGKTWSEITTPIDFPEGESASDPSMVYHPKTKTVFMFYNYMNHKNGKEFRFHIVKSTDNGTTWSKPMDITDQVSPSDWKNDFKFITSGLGIVTKEGWLLNTLVRFNDGVYVIGSKDNGNTWQRFPAVANTADETNIVEIEKGKWLLNARVKNLGYRKIFISEDNGNSWIERTETQLEDPTCNASTLKIGKKKLLFSNLHSQKKRENLGIKISDDNGTTWKLLKTIEPGSSAYSVLVPLGKKTYGILYEADGYKDIIFETFEL